MKKIIRLTENDLHKIVKEAVKRIVNEEDSGLDPRTLASYAEKRAQQGQHEKAEQGRRAAMDTWNKKYGTEVDKKDSNGNWHNRTIQNGINNAGYNVRTQTYNYNGDNKFNNVESNVFYPNGENYRVHDIYGNDGHKHEMTFNNDDYDDEALSVAQQMSDGSGKYIPGKGWQ